MNGLAPWGPMLVGIGAIAVQGVIGWAVLQMVQKIQDRHAVMLEVHGVEIATLRGSVATHTDEIGRLRDRLDG